MAVGLSGDAQIVATNQNTRPMLVNTWKVDMFNWPGLFVTTAVQCVLIGRLCAIMSQKWKQARQRVWQNYHWKVALNLVLAHCFFLELESYIVSKMSKLTSNRKADLLRLGGGVTGQEGLKLVFWTKITPFYWRKFCLLLSAHSSAKDSQVHNLLRTRAWTRHWRWSVLTVESVAKGFQVGGSWNNTSPNVGRAQV